jgi:type IV pilus assembly protein PilA
MLKVRKGFTLIELLIVIVIIGILAAIAIPKFGKTREKAYYNAMQSDLRNLQSQQEVYYSNPVNLYNYAAGVAVLPDFQVSGGVTVGIAAATSGGWSATATHAALLATQTCAVYAGNATAVAPATAPGVIACTGM